MRLLYLGYTTRQDPETHTWCVSGLDSAGKWFGGGAGHGMDECEQALRDYVLDVLDSHAADGEDHFGDLLTEPPEGPYMEFNSLELFPIRLKLARKRAGLRQADMAARLGITQQGYAKLERSGANPTLRTIVQAERVIGLDLFQYDDGVKRKKMPLRSSRA